MGALEYLRFGDGRRGIGHYLHDPAVPGASQSERSYEEEIPSDQSLLHAILLVGRLPSPAYLAQVVDVVVD